MKIRVMAIAMDFLSIISCKKDSEGEPETIVEPVTQASNYTQLEVGNHWVYERTYINYETGE
ncbi:MAG: hypothetical protein ACI8XB_001201 [Patiriisocius sp.]|jgi:hypothetical protein